MPDRPTVFLSDANVLIDYRDSDITILSSVVEHIAPLYVVRDVLDQVDELSLARCRDLGLTVIDVDPEVLLKLPALPRRLDRRDRLSFHVSRENDWICVTNDRPLRRVCEEYNVRVRWGLELMSALTRARVLPASRALTIARRIRANNPYHITEEILARFAVRITSK